MSESLPSPDATPGVAAAPLAVTDSSPLIVTLVPTVLLAATLVVVAIRSVAPLGDPDTLWHLLLGRRLVQTWDFGPGDPLSPLSTQPWVYNQWLPEVVAAGAESLGGLAAIVWLTVAGRLAVLLALWVLCRSRAAALPAALAAVLAFVGTYGALGARPQLVGVLLLVPAVWAAYGTAQDGRPRWWLVPFTWVWASVHGLWVFGVALGLVVALAAMLERRHEPLRAHLGRSFVPLASVAVAGLTPVGPRLLLAYFHVAGINDFIQEWQPSSVSEPMFLIVVVTAGLLLTVWLRGGHRPRWTELALVVFAVACALATRRTIAVGAIVLAPLVADALQSVVGRARVRVSRSEVGAIAAATAVGLTVAALIMPAAARQPGNVPLGLSAQLAALPAQVVYNEHGQGGWILWAFPHLTPVIDTRSEVYGRAYVVDFLDTTSVKAGWQERLARSGARAALLEEEGPLATALVERLGWRVVGRADGSVLLVAP